MTYVGVKRKSHLIFLCFSSKCTGE